MQEGDKFVTRTHTMDGARFGNGLPKDMADSIELNLKVDKASRRKKLGEWKKKLKDIQAPGTAEKCREAFARQPPHVGRV